MKSPSRVYSVLIGIAYACAIGAVCWITTESPFHRFVWLIFLVLPIYLVAMCERILVMWLCKQPWTTLRPALWLAASLAILVWFELPIRAKFYLSRPALEQAAREAPFSTPRRAGLFVLENATVSDDLVFLGKSKWGYNFVGLIQRPRGSEPYSGNAWYEVGLDSGWQFYHED